jgi:hypothetical protein
MELSIQDVPGDGSCFYTSIATALAFSQPVGAIDAKELARDLRFIIANLAVTEVELVDQMLDEVEKVCYQDEDINCYLADTAVDLAHNKLAKEQDRKQDKRHSRKTLASFMKKSTSYASFIDVELMRMYLANRKILLLVFGSKESLEDRGDWDSMIEAESKRCLDAKRLVVLFNIEGRHYNWISVDSKSVPSLRQFGR